jgi:hypothetical protein
MLGSLHDADDAIQDALLRAWRGLCGFGGRGSLRNWLYRIATNACLDALARRPKHVLPIDYGPPADADAGEPGEPLARRLPALRPPGRACGVVPDAARHSSPSGTTPPLKLATCSGVKGGRESSSRRWNAQKRCTM